MMKIIMRIKIEKKILVIPRILEQASSQNSFFIVSFDILVVYHLG